MEKTTVEKRFKTPIIIVSIVIPLAVVLLFSIRLKDFGINVEPLTFLPPIYAAINGITAILLILGVQAIKKGNRALHHKLMTSAIACSAVAAPLPRMNSPSSSTTRNPPSCLGTASHPFVPGA